MAYRVFFYAVPENRRSPTTCAWNQGFFRLLCWQATHRTGLAPPEGGHGLTKADRGLLRDAAGGIGSRLRQRRPAGLQQGWLHCLRGTTAPPGNRPSDRNRTTDLAAR